MLGLTKDDTKVWISGCDIDGTARGKLLSREKIDSGLSLGFCNVIFAWDCLDKNYHPKPPAAMQNTGFKDIIAQVDTKTMRRDPITNIPHFLVDFKDENMVPLEYCPRSLLKRVLASNSDYLVLAGVEFEFYNYKETEQTLAIKKVSKI